MDFKEFFEDIKEKITDLTQPLIEKATDFYEENKKLSLLILGLSALILILLILLIAVSGSKKKEEPQIPGTVLELTETPLIPDGPELPKDYTPSRITKDKWTDEQAQQWFTVPSQNEIDSLSKSNDIMINEILGAAP